MYGTLTEFTFVFVPWVLSGLFVTQAEFTSVYIEFKHFYLEFVPNGYEFRRVLDLLGP